MNEPKNKFRVEGEVVWITLTQGRETCIDLADWSEVRKHRWFADGAYVRTRIKNIRPALHAFLLQRKGVDHRDVNGFNNCRYNLRPCTLSQNQENRRRPRNNTSGFKGVVWEKSRKKWRMQLQRQGICLSVSRHDTKIEAAYAYNQAAIAHFGDFAQPNNI